MPQVVNKKVKLVLVGVDGNAFSLLAAFMRQARRENWAAHEIEAVCEAAQSGNYSNLLMTLSDHCVNGGYADDGDDEP